MVFPDTIFVVQKSADSISLLACKLTATACVRAGQSLVVHFRSSHTCYSCCQFQVLGFDKSRTHPGDQGVQVSAGKFPLERMCDALVVVLEVFEALGDCLEAREVVRCERLALNNREVDLALVKPIRMHWAMYWHHFCAVATYRRNPKGPVHFVGTTQSLDVKSQRLLR
jgi:hypothetical protein